MSSCSDHFPQSSKQSIRLELPATHRRSRDGQAERVEPGQWLSSRACLVCSLVCATALFIYLILAYPCSYEAMSFIPYLRHKLPSARFADPRSAVYLFRIYAPLSQHEARICYPRSLRLAGCLRMMRFTRYSEGTILKLTYFLIGYAKREGRPEVFISR